MPGKKQLKYPTKNTESKSNDFSIDDLRAVLNVQPEIQYNDWTMDTPKVPTPPMFRPETFVVGTKLAQEMERLYKLAPQLRGRAKEVTPALTDGAIKEIIKDGFYDPLNTGTLNGSNVMGLTNRDRRISIATGTGIYNTRKDKSGYDEVQYPDKDNFDTLTHELYHIIGKDGLETGNSGFGWGPDTEINSNAIGTMAGRLYDKLLLKYPTKVKNNAIKSNVR